MRPVDHHTDLAQTGSKNRLQVTGPTYYQYLLVNTTQYGLCLRQRKGQWETSFSQTVE